ncbi:MAG: hypothetical protein JSV21_08935 [Nitrospirota bacterium]|nr:MAG: hypothetical protein JSV21_08935 [Nitrospirota bacterium]
MSEKVVIRYPDGKILKGHVVHFSETDEDIKIKEDDTNKEMTIPVADLKAVFFVRSFEGKRTYSEKKIYGIREKKGDRAFVKFKDGETLMGFLIGDVPWDKKKGYFISKVESDQKGFFIMPVDRGSNNIKTFVLLGAVEDVSIMH